MSYDTKFGEFKPWWTDGFLKSQDYLQPIWSQFTVSFRYFLKRGINVCQEFYMIFYRVFFFIQKYFESIKAHRIIFIKSQFFIVWWEAMLMVTSSSSSPVNTLGLSLVFTFLHRLLQTQSSWLVWPHDSSDDNILSASLKVQLSPSLEDDKRKCKILYWNTRRIFYSNYDWISLLNKFQNFWKLKNIFQFWTC